MEFGSAIPGVASHPENPRYLSPGMPWTSARHMSDRELWAIVAYLQYGVRPVENEVPENEAPPDHWASWFSVEQIGPHPVGPFATYARNLTPDNTTGLGRFSKRQIFNALRYGLKPVRNRVPDSEGPSDFWVSVFTPENFGTHPAPPFPTAREQRSW